MESVDRQAEDLGGMDEAARRLATGAPPPHDGLLALRLRDFRLMLLGRFLSVLGRQMLAVAIGWELYDRTGDALALGLVGLAQVVPELLLALPAGHVADTVDRRRIVVFSQVGMVLASLGLAAISFTRGPLPAVYLCLLLVGATLAFNDPAASSLVAGVVPKAVFANAATWNSSAFQLAAVVGPALAGVVIAVQRSASWVYVFNAALALGYIGLLVALRPRPMVRGESQRTLRSLAEGIAFLRQSRVLLAAITLDLFAVLLGGATTLLPIYAKDILQVGPVGLGWLRAAPSVGAVAMALSVAFLPPFRRAGRALLLAVAGFGIATIVFGLSRSFVLSLAMLCLLGALDNISVIIRGTLLLVRTPDALRGRVSAVNSVFIGASNELGGFESGLAAALFNPVIAVVGGGVGTLLVVAAVAWRWPEMRRLGALHEDAPPGPTAPATDR